MKNAAQLYPNHDRCYVCGESNPRGLGVEFCSEDGVTSGTYTTNRGQESVSGVVHGGLLTTLLDAAMARWLFDRGIVAYTAILEVRFRASLEPGERIRVEARKRRQRGRRFYMEANLYNDSGRQVVGARALFIQSDRPGA